MAENRNCPNCGAPYDVQLNKCPYCGTSYFDLSCLQVGDNPFYLKIKDSARGITVTQKCYLRNASFSVESHDVYCDNSFNYIYPFCATRDLMIDLSLEAIAENNTLATVTTEAV